MSTARTTHFHSSWKPTTFRIALQNTKVFTGPTARVAFIVSVFLGSVGFSGEVAGSDPVIEENKAAASKTIKAGAFELVDSEGRVRGRWGTLDSGAISLTLHGETGEPRVMLSVMPDGVTGLALFDVKGRPRCIFATRGDRGSSMSMMDADGKVRGEWSLSQEGSCAVTLNDRRGNQRAVLSSVDGNRTGLVIFDQKGDPAAHVGESDGTRALTLYGPSDREIKFSAFVNDDSNPSLHLYDKNGKQRGVWIATEGGSGISLFDAKERPRGVFGTTPQGDTGLLIFDESGDVRIRAPKDFDIESSAWNP